METTGENSRTLCHERHVGDKDERDREGKGGVWGGGQGVERMRGNDGELTRMMCVSQQ